MKKSECNYKLTKYPNIFKNTYWGNLIISERNEIDDIIKNRNNFVNENNIKQNKKSVPQKAINFFFKLDELNDFYLFDHIEVYKNDEEYIIINNPYMTKDSEDYNKLINYGWKEIEKLYFDESITFMKKIKLLDIKNKTSDKKYYKDYHKKYHQERNKEKIICQDCGKKYSYSHKSRHEKTKIHKIIKLSSEIRNLSLEEFQNYLNI